MQSGFDTDQLRNRSTIGLYAERLNLCQILRPRRPMHLPRSQLHRRRAIDASSCRQYASALPFCHFADCSLELQRSTTFMPLSPAANRHRARRLHLYRNSRVPIVPDVQSGSSPRHMCFDALCDQAVSNSNTATRQNRTTSASASWLMRIRSQMEVRRAGMHQRTFMEVAWEDLRETALKL